MSKFTDTIAEQATAYLTALDKAHELRRRGGGAVVAAMCAGGGVGGAVGSTMRGSGSISTGEKIR